MKFLRAIVGSLREHRLLGLAAGPDRGPGGFFRRGSPHHPERSRGQERVDEMRREIQDIVRDDPRSINMMNTIEDRLSNGSAFKKQGRILKNLSDRMRSVVGSRLQREDPRNWQRRMREMQLAVFPPTDEAGIRRFIQETLAAAAAPPAVPPPPAGPPPGAPPAPPPAGAPPAAPPAAPPPPAGAPPAAPPPPRGAPPAPPVPPPRPAPVPPPPRAPQDAPAVLRTRISIIDIDLEQVERDINRLTQQIQGAAQIHGNARLPHNLSRHRLAAELREKKQERTRLQREKAELQRRMKGPPKSVHETVTRKGLRESKQAIAETEKDIASYSKRYDLSADKLDEARVLVEEEIAELEERFRKSADVDTRMSVQQMLSRPRRRLGNIDFLEGLIGKKKTLQERKADFEAQLPSPPKDVSLVKDTVFSIADGPWHRFETQSMEGLKEEAKTILGRFDNVSFTVQLDDDGRVVEVSLDGIPASIEERGDASISKYLAAMKGKIIKNSTDLTNLHIDSYKAINKAFILFISYFNSPSFGVHEYDSNKNISKVKMYKDILSDDTNEMLIDKYGLKEKNVMLMLFEFTDDFHIKDITIPFLGDALHKRPEYKKVLEEIRAMKAPTDEDLIQARDKLAAVIDAVLPEL